MRQDAPLSELEELSERVGKRLASIKKGVLAGEITPDEALFCLNEALRALEPVREGELPLPVRRELAAFVDVMEKERAILADLIREAGNNLANASVDLTVLAAEVEKVSPEAGEKLKALKDVLLEGAKAMKNLLLWLQPLEELARLDLKEGLEYFARQVVEYFPAKVSVELQNLPPKIPSVMALALFRIVQGILYFSLRYACAEEVRVDCRRTPDALVLEVLDNGRPLDERRPEEFSPLVVAYQHVRWLGGSLKFYRKEDKANLVEITVPYAL